MVECDLSHFSFLGSPLVYFLCSELHSRLSILLPLSPSRPPSFPPSPPPSVPLLHPPPLYHLPGLISPRLHRRLRLLARAMGCFARYLLRSGHLNQVLTGLSYPPLSSLPTALFVFSSHFIF